MGHYEQGDHRHNELASNLYNVASTTASLLPEVDLKHGEVRRLGSHPVGGSPAFDIWEGEYLGREKCAIKVIRGVEVTPNVTKVSSGILNATLEESLTSRNSASFGR